MILGLIFAATTPQARAASSTEPLLFEYIGELVTGLSYVHSVIPVDLYSLERQLSEYQATLEREFAPETLERTHKEFVHRIKETTKVNRTTDSLNFDRSLLAKWKEIGETHVEEVSKLRERLKALLESVPPVNSEEGPNEKFQVKTREDDPWNLDFKKSRDDSTQQPRSVPFTRRPGSGNVFTKRPRSRRKRHPLALAAGAAAAVAGTIFGIYNTVQINAIWDSIDKIEKRMIAYEELFNDVTKDIVELQDEVHGILLKQLIDSAFDTGLLVARLRTQYAMFEARVDRYFDAMQFAKMRRLALNYLDEPTLKRIYTQAKYRARQVNCNLLIRQPSDLFELELSYTYDGRKVYLMLHIPIAPAESNFRLYRLHTFPLPFTNDTFLIPDVQEHLLGISNTNHRYAVQYSLMDLQSCHQMARIFLCERNGNLFKYPEDTCLGALYQQKYEDARNLCSFHLEPAREYVRQLKDNWYLIYTEVALTVPTICANKSYSEIHIRAGASKFHLTAGCTADLPRHRLVSDLSVLIPQDYIQFEMEWDPTTFLPDIRDYIIPEFHKLQRYGMSRASLATLQANVANSLDYPKWYHKIHFSGNTISVITAVIGMLITAYMCIRSRRKSARARRGRRMEDAVRTALNSITPRSQLPGQLALPMPVITHPPSTVFTQPPANPSVIEFEQLPMMTRPNSYTNLTSVSEAAMRRSLPEGVPPTPYGPSCPSTHYGPLSPPSQCGPMQGYAPSTVPMSSVACGGPIHDCGLPAYRKSSEI